MWPDGVFEAGRLQTHHRDGKGGQLIIPLVLKGLGDGCQGSISLKNWSLPTQGVKLSKPGIPVRSWNCGEKPGPTDSKSTQQFCFIFGDSISLSVLGLKECATRAQPYCSSSQVNLLRLS